MKITVDGKTYNLFLRRAGDGVDLKIKEAGSRNSFFLMLFDANGHYYRCDRSLPEEFPFSRDKETP